VSDIAERFARETADHRMTVLHDDGLYRHLRFRSPKNSFYWFDLITVPGSLIFRGDGQSFVFARLDDMFEFFRGPVGRINPHYWAEKLTSHQRDEVKCYDRDIFERQVREAVDDAVRDGSAPVGLVQAVQESLLDSEEIDYESGAREALRSFTFYKNPADCFDPRKQPDFQFHDTWEWDFRDYDWWFLWALHGIVWGIAQYDAAKPPAVRDVVAAGGVL
jgi:hypothetical protein